MELTKRIAAVSEHKVLEMMNDKIGQVRRYNFPVVVAVVVVVVIIYNSYLFLSFDLEYIVVVVVVVAQFETKKRTATVFSFIVHISHNYHR